MTFHRAASFRRFVFLAPVLGALGLMPAEGAITLLIDTNAKTFTWSGTATSASFDVAPHMDRFFRIGTGSWVGGNVSGQGIGSLTVSFSELSPGDDSRFFPQDPGMLVVQAFQNSFYTDLGMMSNIGATPGNLNTTNTLTVAGNGVSYSYTGLPVQAITYLESLDGTALYFQIEEGGVTPLGSAAGQIVVIPEPSSALLGLAASAVLMRRRRERAC